MTEQEIEDQNPEFKEITNVEKFYSLNKFSIVDGSGNVPDDFALKNKHLKLSYRKTCDILRPPRSFHCSICEMCVEVHDHHCPWVGTCIGRRNTHYFIGFLFWTFLHSVVVLLTCIYTRTLDGRADHWFHKDETFNASLNNIMIIYTGIFAVLLGSFTVV